MHKLIFLLITTHIIYGQVIDNQKDKVEFIGLKEWPAQTLVDTLKALNPDKPFHACASVLIHDLKFSEASVISYDYEDGFYTVVTVIEPQDSSRVNYYKIRSELSETPLAWKKTAKLFKSNYGAVQLALQFYGFFLSGQTDSITKKLSDFDAYLNPDKAKMLWDFLQIHNSEKDKEIALWTLTNDSNEVDRMVAIAILANFSNSDLVWWHLVGALRDPNQMVRGIAKSVLFTLRKTLPRKINWEPAISSLRWIVNGTNLFAFTSTLQLLVDTYISPELANKLLKDNSTLILSYLKAKHEKSKELVQNFLVYMSGQNFTQYTQWQDWINKINSQD